MNGFTCAKAPTYHLPSAYCSGCRLQAGQKLSSARASHLPLEILQGTPIPLYRVALRVGQARPAEQSDRGGATSFAMHQFSGCQDAKVAVSHVASDTCGWAFHLHSRFVFAQYDNPDADFRISWVLPRPLLHVWRSWNVPFCCCSPKCRGLIESRRAFEGVAARCTRPVLPCVCGSSTRTQAYREGAGTQEGKYAGKSCCWQHWSASPAVPVSV